MIFILAIFIIFMIGCTEDEPMGPDTENKIELLIYSGISGDLLKTMYIEEGEITISAAGDDVYAVHAKQEMYYTNLYNCQKGDVINVDLEPTAAGKFCGVVFLTIKQALSNAELRIIKNNEYFDTLITDENGRFAIDIPSGNYELEYVDTQQDTFYFEFDISAGSNYKDFVFFELETAYKSNIYIYPEVEMALDVSLEFPLGGKVTTSIPEYGNGWHVTATPDGLIDNQYEYLFYEAVNPDVYQSDTGWIMSRNDLESFFAQNFRQTGFSQKETSDFTDYWIPRLIDYLIIPTTPSIPNILTISKP